MAKFLTVSNGNKILQDIVKADISDFTESDYFRFAVDDTDDITEGSTNLFFTDTRAKDAVGAILTDTATIDFTYVSDTEISAVVIDDSITVSKLAHNIDATSIGFNADKVDGKDVNDSGTDNTVLWTAEKIANAIDAAIDGLSWQDHVIDYTLATPPGSPSSGDRYVVGSETELDIISTTSATKTIVVLGDVTSSIATSDTIKIKGAVTAGVDGQYTVVSSTFDSTNTNIVVTETISDSTSEGDLYYASGAWSVFGPDEIVEYTGSAWSNQTSITGTPESGWVTVATDQGNVEIVYTGTNWVTRPSSTSHNNLSGLQGGTSGEYYHLTSAQLTGLTGGSDTTLHSHDTDNLTEGSTNLFFTNTRARDAVGGILADTNTIDFTYTSDTELKADLVYEDSNSIDLSDSATGLKADLKTQDSNTATLTVPDASGLKVDVEYQTTDSVTLADDASGLSATVKTQNSTSINLSVPDASGLQATLNINDTNTVDLTTGASGLEADVLYQNGNVTTASDDASGLKIDVNYDTNTLDVSGTDLKVKDDVFDPLNGLTVVAGENLAAGDYVNIYNDGGTLKARKASAADNTKPAHGFVLSAITAAASGIVMFDGINSSVSGRTVGARQFLSASTPGALTETIPTTTNNIVQEIGVGLASGSVNSGDLTDFYELG